MPEIFDIFDFLNLLPIVHIHFQSLYISKELKAKEPGY